MGGDGDDDSGGAGDGFRKCGLEEEMAGPIAGVRVVEAPILLLVYFHKALRAELTELHRVCLSWLENGCRGVGDDVIDGLIRRFRFLKLVYKYHCATEDEVIFQALDQRVANIACSYSLEHGDIDDLFDSVFQNLDVLLNGDDKLSSFQHLALSTSTIKMSICQHMLKEEQQVFPLLIQRFSFEEQALLVWQFICSVPVMLLEDFLPWMTSYLPADEQVDIMNCLKMVVPKEKLLQEAVISWLGKRSKISLRVSSTRGNGKVSSSFVEPLNFKDLQKNDSYWMSLYGENFCPAGSFCHHENGKHHPVDGLLIWHNAIRKDFNEILEELHEIRSSSIFSSLALVSGQLKFLADVLIFYSDALEKVFFSVLNEISNGCLSFSHQRFPEEGQIGGLFSVLQNVNSQNETSLCKLVETLCWLLESFIVEMIKHFSFQESKVFPLIRNHCTHEMQQQLLYTSLHMMPLGLLKCVITWLSARLTEDESKVVFWSIKLAGSEDDTCFASLLHEWVRIGYSGKISMEKFREELQRTFRNRGSFRSEQVNENTGPCQTSRLCQIKPKSADKAESSVYDSSSEVTEEKHSTLCSSGINLQIYFPEVLKKLSPVSKYLAKKVDAGSSLNPELKPIDHIFLFHKALRNDLEYLVHLSAKMTENVGLVKEFLQRFHILRFLYQIHSENEDEIAFPALEAKGKLQNISHAYTVDHKLEAEYFNRISTILDEILELNVYELSPGMDATRGQIMIKYCQLCMKLHRMCKTMCIMLVKHVQREEIELWPLFTECFSNEEQERIIGCVLGRTRAEVLREMIPWLMASLSTGEQNALLSLWLKATKNTMFDEWLSEWWEGMNKHDVAVIEEESTILPSRTADPLEIVFTYLSEEACNESKGRTLHEKGLTFPQIESVACNLASNGKGNEDNHTKALNRDLGSNQSLEVTKHPSEDSQQGIKKVLDVKDQVDKHDPLFPLIKKSNQQEELVLTLSQEDLEAAVRRVSRDATLNTQKKSYIIQNLLMSRWLATQQKPHQEVIMSNGDGEIPGQFPSYRDPLKQTLGCKHYKRKCKLFADCCKKLFTCRYCHDDVASHSLDLKSTTKMMCMICLKVQPIGPTCSNISCNNLSMAKYFCAICRLYEDEREIYHCPYCNLCRVGKGLGVDYFHCMNCNACMSKSLSLHVCREKCFESNCPICHEDIFTSCSPVKALPCGHMMHSTCFQDYTCTHYTCPICSKSLGDMQLYFGMLDVLLAEEKVPQEYQGQTQMILCNDCEKRGVASFHWLYHKCPHCGSYNTRPI